MGSCLVSQAGLLIAQMSVLSKLFWETSWLRSVLGISLACIVFPARLEHSCVQMCSAGKIWYALSRSPKISLRMGHREAGGLVDGFVCNRWKRLDRDWHGSRFEDSESVWSLLKSAKVFRCCVKFLKLQRKVGRAKYSRKEEDCSALGDLSTWVAQHGCASFKPTSCERWLMHRWHCQLLCSLKNCWARDGICDVFPYFFISQSTRKS